MIITLKVLPHVKEFITSKSPEYPIRLTEKSWQTDILTFRMKSSFKRNSFMVATDKLLPLEIELPEIISKQYRGKLLSYQLANYYDSFFKEELCTHIRAQTRAGFSVTNSIVDFFTIYNIDEDSIDVKSAYKIWQRHVDRCKKIEEKKSEKK